MSYFPDILPTIAEACGARIPADVDGLSILPTLLEASVVGRQQPRHEYLYWEINGWTAIRQGTWRAVKPAKFDQWELYDLAADPSEAKNVGALYPETLARLIALAAKAHQPVREGTFASTDLHERDRRSKYGKHEDDSFIATPSTIRKKAP